MRVKEALAEKIAGEITLSPYPGKTMRKWRAVFSISQTRLAEFLEVSPSVISDYESGRRKSPGIQTIKKIIEAFIDLDEKENNGQTIQRYRFISKVSPGIKDIREYPLSVDLNEFIRSIGGNLLTKKVKKNIYVRGFTLVDSIETIKTLDSRSYPELYGWNPERALVFLNVRYGRSPMIAIKIHPVKPSVVVYHKPGAVDPLAVQLAEQENIPLVITNLPLDEVKSKLLSFTR